MMPDLPWFVSPSYQTTLARLIALAGRPSVKKGRK